MCKCGLGHRGWEEPRLCNIEIYNRQLRASLDAMPVAAKPVTRDAPKEPKPLPVMPKAPSHVTASVTRDKSATRMADLRKRKAASGLIEVRGVWAHPDDMAAIKALAKSLSKARGSPSS